MTRALVLMKAMPPTRGHSRLIEFAKSVSERGVVLMDCAPGEPMIHERQQWLFDNVYDGRGWVDERLTLDDQDPSADGFWERWQRRLMDFGDFDYVIGSEAYCAKVAEVIDARYLPYDPARELYDSHANRVRDEPMTQFASIAPDFQHHLRTTVTIFGAESTGKTTLSRRLAEVMESEWIFEWARPYLENTNQTVVDLQAMHDIWHGQYAVEENANKFALDKPFIFRDTDLYSTIGYWEQPQWQDDLGKVPQRLKYDAQKHKADLYIITSSDIPFEKDPLRYGGDHRESSDEYWISVAEKYLLNYVVLTDTDRSARLEKAVQAVAKAGYEKTKPIRYTRELVSS